MGPRGDKLESGPPFAIVAIAALAIPFVVVLLVAPMDGETKQRAGLALLGGILCALARLRPRVWWEHHRVMDARASFGDRAYVLFHFALGLLFAVGAWFVPLG